MEITRVYLNGYISRLVGVQTTDQLYGLFYHWQHEQGNNAAHAQGTINRIFFPDTSDIRRLYPAQPLTTAIGGFNGVVILSANPHYDRGRNTIEQRLRRTAEGSRHFCEEFFTNENVEQRSHTQKSQWWRNAAKFAFDSTSTNGKKHEEVAKDEWRALEKGHGQKWAHFRLQHLWNWAGNTGCVGAVDLLPFHSNQDGITGLIEHWQDNERADDASNVKRLLHAIATQTFKMVLRLRPRVILVVSKAGAIVADSVMGGLHPTFTQITDVVCRVASSPPWNHEHRYRLHHYLSTTDDRPSTRVLTVPNQLFSTRGAQNGLGEVRTDEHPKQIRSFLR
jgi:hypothetical protein